MAKPARVGVDGFVNHSDMHDWSRPLDWVIVGGESGPGARPFDLAWARSIVQQCKAAGVSVFCKQIGPHPIEDGRPALLRHGSSWLYRPPSDKKGGDPSEWPEDLRVRQFPDAVDTARTIAK